MNASRDAARRRHGARLVRKLALSVAATLLCLAVVEAGYRLHLYGVSGLLPTPMMSMAPAGQAGIFQASEIPEVRYELRPQLDTVLKMRTVLTNSRGMRDEERPLAKPRRTYRIAFLGDSFTFGSGVHADETYHALLEVRLEEDPTLRYECLNFGVPGYSLRDYEAVLAHKVLAHEPDLIVICSPPNDRTPVGAAKREYVSKPKANYFLRLHSLDAAWHAIQAARFRGEGESASERERAKPVHDQALRYMRRTLAGIARIASEAEVPIILIHFRLSAGAPRSDGIAEAFRSVCAESGIRFLDAGPAFIGFELADLQIFPNDAHPNARAHSILAETIFSDLEASGWLPLSARGRR